MTDFATMPNMSTKHNVQVFCIKDDKPVLRSSNVASRAQFERLQVSFQRRWRQTSQFLLISRDIYPDSKSVLYPVISWHKRHFLSVIYASQSSERYSEFIENP